MYFRFCFVNYLWKGKKKDIGIHVITPKSIKVNHDSWVATNLKTIDLSSIKQRKTNQMQPHSFVYAT